MQQKKNKTKSKHVLYDVVYGAHAIIECLKAKKRKLASLYTTKPLPKAYERIQPYLPKVIPNIQYVERNVLSSMAKSHEHMGVVALVSPFTPRKKMFNPAQEPFLVVLDGVQDVGNLGSILRSAYCAGVNGVILSSKGSAPITAAVFKTSAGLAEHLDIMITSSLKTTLQDLAQAGYAIYLAVVDKGENALNVDFKKPMCVVIGNEEVGIKKDLQALGSLITLPQRTPDISYNAAIAASILMFLMGNKKSGR